ncbi:MAG: PepSY domain-containing protein [Fusobacterium sp.]|nr:PepSY domain-containing protein [Fusobacterium sp.]
MKNKKRIINKIFKFFLIVGGLTFSIKSYANNISIEEANKIALKETVNGQILKSELDDKDGILVYEIEILENNIKKEFEIDAFSGRILKIENSYDNKYLKNNKISSYNSEIKISIEEAKNIALSNSKNGIIKSIELENKRGIPIYEVEVQEGIMEKEFKIDAVNGNILKIDLNL